MLPADTQGPHRNKRWIELENVGDVDIPPFGACEVVDSYRPEAGSSITPGGGRTVWKVRRSETDNPCNSVINGSCLIPAASSGEIPYGRPGTKDDPMLALVAEQYAPQTQVGIKAGSFYLQENYCGYVVDGDYDPPSETQQVTRYDNCQSSHMVRMLQCHLPGSVDTLAQPQKWDENAECWVDDMDKDPIKICDCCGWLLALPDDVVKVEREGSCGSSSTCWRPAFPYGLTRRVFIEDPIECDACGEVTILDNMGGLSECKINARNTNNRQLACDADEYATLHIAPGPCNVNPNDCMGWLVANARPLRAVATLSDDMCGGDAEIADIQYKDVCEWNPRIEPNEAQNPKQHLACADNKVELGWNDMECAWEVVSVQPTLMTKKPMVDLQCGANCSIEKQVPVGDVAVEMCPSCNEYEWDSTQATGSTITYLSDASLDCDACEWTRTYRKACVLCSSDELDSEDVTSLETIDIPSGISASCSDSGTGGTGGGGGSCSVQLTTERYCILGCSKGSGDPVDLGGDVVSVVDDTYFRQDGTDLKMTEYIRHICVLASCPTEYSNTDIVSGTDCSEES